MELKVTFPGGLRVNAEFAGGLVETDQPVSEGGEGSAPTPFQYFLASLATCAGIYVLSFCRQRGIATEGLALTQRAEFASEAGKKKLSKVILDIDLPPGFPEKYRNAVSKAAALCAVKKALMEPPEFEIKARIPGPGAVSE